MKIRSELGSDAVRELIEAASKRARQLPDRSVRDPWPCSRRVISDSVIRDGCAAGMAWCPGGDLCDHTAGSRCMPETEAVLDDIFEDAAWEAAVDDAIMDAIAGP